MVRFSADGGRLPTTLFEAAAYQRTVAVRCPGCDHQAVFSAHALWWHFHRRGWDQRLAAAGRRLRCAWCGRRGVPITLGDAPPTVTSLPMPDIAEWKRAVNRFRS